ncbi:STAS domain-containing protein [Micromonospora sp. PPF5-17]|uniref:Anti-sigma factor antagonist n=1 Tax=Micromonospora solifontis TaxID=2487138 RepID=A0ABX9WHE2_9ACTN|nr:MULTISPECIES: STAS domain-containing protein [Micromonospora]NES37401.1 STAS domain-containing protein [Micromonospora solifontis]NES58054.1 STAS domain-containing protein [Micromonospora sp. PPF5-6]RNL98409.1 anti-sigma factor antagonist [Micromonospora solifontis]
MSVHHAPCFQPPDATTRAPLLSLAVVREGPAIVVEATGPLDLDTVGRLADVVDNLMASQPPPVLVLDLNGVSFFCAAGVTALLAARRRVAACGRTMVLRRPSRVTVAVLDMVGLGCEFTTID